ncbi:MAG TPA: response regulator transcription factor [Thiobacillaceae bacterium]|nr:response regulator transcription factor [Thiobacillaceae bacterium]
MRILLVEDDPALASSLNQGLRQMGFAVELSQDGGEADAILSVRKFDAVVLDLGLPGLSGMEVLKRLRKRGATLPVLILTARDAMADKVAGLNAGADDYLLKPFDFQELEARLNALLRRTQAERSGWLEAGRLRLDRSARQAFLDLAPLPLSAREVGVLELLMSRLGRVVSKEQLAEHLSQDEEIGENAVEVYVHRLRKKLEAVGIEIRTLRGLGYLLEKDLP